MDFETLSVSQIKELQTKAAEQLKIRAEKEKEELIANLREIVEQHGYSLEELFGNKSRKATKKQQISKVKYVSNDGVFGWTGRGPRPKWIRDFLTSGGELDELLAT